MCAPDPSCRWVPIRQHVNDLPEAPVELHIYPGQDGSFELYEDEGDQYNYEDGAFSTIDIHWKDAERQLILEARKGSTPECQNNECLKFSFMMREPSSWSFPGQVRTKRFATVANRL